MPDLSLTVWIAVAAIGVLAGVVKGAVGFAMPMIMVSGLGSFLAPELAVAGLVLPTLVTNVFQALRDGPGAAFGSARRHWRFVVIVMVMIALSAQLVVALPAEALFLAIGVPVTLFAVVQLAGLRPSFVGRGRRVAEIVLALIAGFVGGISGVWGPPTVLYLTALDTPKVEQMRIQGVVYGSGAVILTAAHVNSGVLNAQTAPFSALLLVPALVGLLAGMRVQDRMDQARFRRGTLLVLTIAGLNLVRRGLFG